MNAKIDPRIYVEGMYPTTGWRRKVKKFSDAQCFAIMQNDLAQQEKSKPKPKPKPEELGF